MGKTSLASAIASYNALVAVHGEEGAYNLVQARLASDAEVQAAAQEIGGTGAIDQAIEDVSRGAEAVRGIASAFQTAANNALLSNLLGIK